MRGWLALELDFEQILFKKDGFQKHGICELHSMLKTCWAQLRLNQSFLDFTLLATSQKRTVEVEMFEST